MDFNKKCIFKKQGLFVIYEISFIQQQMEKDKVNKEQDIWAIFQHAQKSIPNNNQSLFTKIEHNYFSHYDQNQRMNIYQILQRWRDESISDLMNSQAITKKENYRFYQQNLILSARVYHRVVQLISFKNNKSVPDQSLEELHNIIRKDNLQFSYNRNFWQKRSKLNTSKMTFIFTFFSKSKPITEQNQKNNCASNILQTFKNKQNCLVKKLLEFLVAIDLIIVKQQQKITNKFLLSLQRINKPSQKQLYLNSIRMDYFQELKNCKCKNDKAEQEIITKKQCPNYYFYSTNNNKSIGLLHKRQNDYVFLQNSHDYIQLMFPNHFSSNFNPGAAPLSYLQSKLFSNDLRLGLKMLKSIIIFFDFLGLKVDLDTLQIKMISQDRLHEALIINTHNHLRIMRILACLSITGFRTIALNLIYFLDKSIQKIKMFSSLKTVFQQKWKIYGQQDYQHAKSMCFLEEEQFPEHHLIFSQMKRLQLQKKGSQVIKK